MLQQGKSPLLFEIFYECKTTKARTGRMALVHHHVDTPVFMPVGTQVSHVLFISGKINIL